MTETTAVAADPVRCPRCGNKIREGADPERCAACGPQWRPDAVFPKSVSDWIPGNNFGPPGLMALAVEACVIAAFVLRLTSGGSAEPAPAPPVVQAPVASHAPAPAPPAPRPAVEFRTEASGRLARIEAPDPRRTLAAFCDHASNRGKLTPLAIAPSIPQSAGERLGIVRDTNDLSALRAVRIRRDARTHRWTIGDGSNPVTLEPVPVFPPGTSPIPF